MTHAEFRLAFVEVNNKICATDWELNMFWAVFNNMANEYKVNISNIPIDDVKKILHYPYILDIFRGFKKLLEDQRNRSGE